MGGPSPAPSVAGISGSLSPNPFGAGCWLSQGHLLLAHSASPWSREGGHLIKKMELPQAPCLNNCSAVMTNSRSGGSGLGEGPLTPLFPEAQAARSPAAWASPNTFLVLGGCQASLTFSSQNRFPAPLPTSLLPAASPTQQLVLAVMSVPLTQAKGAPGWHVCTRGG